jgi:hypothetical protein
VTGTSAPTLATVWAGPLDLLAALAEDPHLEDLTIQEATVEMKSTFDRSGGNARNHDLAVCASATSGERVIIFVEAKAGEPLGATVAMQRKAAAKAKQKNADSKAEKRLNDLVNSYGREGPRIEEVRYQLLTAWAGALASATGFRHVVLAVHEFRTDVRPKDKTPANAKALELFADVVLGFQLNPGRTIPWCQRLPHTPSPGTSLYLAHVATDLTTESLKVAKYGAGPT